METVHTVAGGTARVVTETDLLEAERPIKWWLVGLLGAILATGVTIGASYGGVVRAQEVNAARIEELRTEGGAPVQELRTDIAVIKAQQANIQSTLEKIEARLDRARIAPADAR